MAKIDQVLVNGTTYEIVPEIAPLFSESTAYTVGDCVIKDGVLYRFTMAHESGEWNASQVEEITVGDEIANLKADLNYYHDGNLIIDDTLITLGTEKQPSMTSTGWKIIDSGSCVRDSEYDVFKYYIAPNTEWYINLGESCIWQFQGSSSISSGVNTDIKGYTHIGAYKGFIKVPSDAHYLMVSAPIDGSTRHVYPYTANVTDYQKYVAKDSQAVLTGEYPIYMEKADGYVYLYMGSIYIRSSLSKTYSISALGNIFTLETSPNGQPNCIKIPCGYSLVYDYDADTLSLASNYTQYSGYKCLLLGYFSTSGNLQGGLIYDRYLLERLENTGIPTYFDSHVDNKIIDINTNMANVGTNGFTFAFVTDQHLPYNSGNTAAIIKRLENKTRMKYVVSGGDIIDVESTKQKALSSLANYCGEFSFLNTPLFSIMGNHDYNTETTQAVSGEDLSIQNFYSVAMRQMENIVIYDDYLDYYYVDSQSKTALVFLQTGKTNGSYHLDQNVALASILPNLPDNVIIISHLLVRVDNGTPVTNGNWNTLVNGSSAKPGLNGMTGKEKIKCIVCGHLHMDWTTYEDNFRLIVTDTNSYKTDPTTKGTVNELAFDVLTFDYTANTCKAVRIGRGSNRSISLIS